MEVRKDFSKRVATLAESTPREAIANLLSALMPRVAAVTRAPKPYTSPLETADYRDAISQYQSPQPSPIAKLKGKVRTRKPRSARYRVLWPGAGSRHRGWRGAMVSAVCSSSTEAEALSYIALHYPPTIAMKGVDLAWCAEQGYITFNLSDGE